MSILFERHLCDYLKIRIPEYLSRVTQFNEIITQKVTFLFEIPIRQKQIIQYISNNLNINNENSFIILTIFNTICINNVFETLRKLNLNNLQMYKLTGFNEYESIVGRFYVFLVN